MDYRWKLKQLKDIPKNRYKVFSCFSCGGGSSMGYKLAGFDVVGNVEIDQRMAQVYNKNLAPVYPYCMDIREFNKIPTADLPEKLLSLDILDGSPPCSTFSMSGKRSKKWGVESHFKEGQKKQRLDMLFFDFIETAEKLQPNVVIAENVSGLLNGHAKGYMSEIICRFKTAGYLLQVFRLNAARMGVPQTRERIFFIAHKKTLALPHMKIAFNEDPIPYGEIKNVLPGPAIANNSVYKKLWTLRKYGDSDLSEADLRLGGKGSHFSTRILYDDRVVNTITASGTRFVRFDSPHYISDNEILLSQSFPEDYDFGDLDVKYVCGMSVPPVMMAKIAEQVKLQWLDKIQK